MPMAPSAQRKSSPESRKHHFVPEFYLKKWCKNSRNTILTYRREYQNKLCSRWTSPGGTGYENDLNNFSHDGKFVFSLEKYVFTDLDNSASIALDGLLSPNFNALTIKHVQDWALFIISLMYRSPKNLNEAANELNEILTRSVAGDGNRYLYERFARIAWDEMAQGPMPIEFARFQAIATAMLREQMLRGLERLVWRKILLPAGISRLLLSDSPVVTHNPDGSHNHFSMPLSPDILLVVAPTAQIMDRWCRRDLGNAINEINVQIANNADKFVFASDDTHRSIVSKYFGAPPAQGYR